jgi:dipeptidyl aminopeptidase/acylaminoacyl peptidase
VWVQQVGCGVQALTFARDGRTLYTVDTAGRLIAWDTSTRAKREVAQKLWWSKGYAESFLELPCGRLVIDVSVAFNLVDPETGKFTVRTPPNRNIDSRAQILPDGRAFFLHTNERAIGGTDLITGAELPTLEVPGVEQNRGVVDSLYVAPDGRSAFVQASIPRHNFLFDITSDHRLVKREPQTVAVSSNARFAPDGRSFVILRYPPHPDLRVWDIERRVARGKPESWAGGEVRIAFNPVLPLFAVPHTTNTVAVRSLETGELVRELDFALGKQITALAFAPDGLTCAVGGTNKRFAVFDVDV